jgi:hypothetical protein
LRNLHTDFHSVAQFRFPQVMCKGSFSLHPHQLLFLCFLNDDPSDYGEKES